MVTRNKSPWLQVHPTNTLKINYFVTNNVDAVVVVVVVVVVLKVYGYIYMTTTIPP